MGGLREAEKAKDLPDDLPFLLLLFSLTTKHVFDDFTLLLCEVAEVRHWG